MSSPLHPPATPSSPLDDKAFQAAEQFLLGRINYERNPRGLKSVTLQRMTRLAAMLGDPQDRLPIIHVAGTKGKGSTCRMLAEILRCAGFRVGLLTSPHLQRVEERIAVDGIPIARDALVRLIEEIRPCVLHMDQQGSAPRGPTYFDILTAAGFLHFARVPVDIAVIEVGLGGRLDSTNICAPRCSVITSISRDHMKQLGDTEALIAREKAGIIKPRVPVVCGVTHQEALAVIRDVARRHAAPLVEFNRDFFVDLHSLQPAVSQASAIASPDETLLGPIFDYRYLDVNRQPHVTPDVQLAMIGDHQAVNAAVAMATIEVLKSQFAVDEHAVRTGLRAARVPARIELLHRQPWVILDGAHNEASLVALCETLDQKWSLTRKTFVFGTTKGKDIRAMLRRALRTADEMILTRYVENPRGADPEAMARLIESLPKSPCQVRVIQSPAEAWQTAWRQAAPGDLICVAGSLFLAAELRERMLGDLPQRYWQPTTV